MPETGSSLIERAKALHNDRRYREVAALLGEAEEATESVELLTILGDAYVVLVRYREAIRTFRRALVLDRKNWETHYRLAWGYAEKGNHRAALNRLRCAQGLAPGERQPRITAVLACAYAHAGRFHRARDTVEGLADPEGGDDVAFVITCRAYIARLEGDYTRARVLCGEALDHDPRLTSLHREMTLLAVSQGDFSSAEKHLDDGLHLSPDDVIFHRMRGDLFWMQDRFAEAAEAYRTASEVSPQSDLASLLQMRVADALYESGNVNEAVSLYDSLAADNPMNNVGIHRVAQVYARNIRGRPGGLIKVLEGVPCMSQKWNWCGPCALAIVAQYWQQPASQEDFPPQYASGMLHFELVERARQAGFAAEAAFGDIPLVKRLLDAGIPVLTAIGDANFGHYHVLFGYDERKGSLWVRETNGWRGFDVPEEDYLKTWGHDGNWLAAIVRKEREADLGFLLRGTDRAVVECSRSLEILSHWTQKEEEALALCRAHSEVCARSPYLAKRFAGLLAKTRAHGELQEFSAAVAGSFPQHNWPIGMRSNTCWLQGRWEEAEALAREAVSLDFRDGMTLHLLSDLYIDRGLWAKAYYFALRSMATRPFDEDNHVNLARIWSQRKRWEKVIPSLEAAVDYAPDDMRILRLLMSAFHSSGQLKGVEERIERAIAHHPGDSLLLAQTALLRVCQGRSTEAQTAADQACAAGCDARELWQALGCLCNEVNDYQGAETAARRSLEASPGNPRGLDVLGWALWSQERFDEAEETARQLVEQEPCLSRAHALLGSCQARRGQGEDGERTLRHALILAPADDWTWMELARLCRSKGAWAQAEEALRHALRYRGEDAVLLAHIAEMEEQQSRHEEALAHYQRALRIQPNDVWLHRALAGTLAELRRFDEALEYSREAIALNESDPWSYMNRVYVCREAGRHGEAQENLQRAAENLQHDPSSAESIVSAALDSKLSGIVTPALDQVLVSAKGHESAVLHYQRARLGGTEEALHHLRAAVSQAPTEPWTYAALAHFYHSPLRRFRSAVRVYRSAIALAKGKQSFEYHVRLAEVYLDWWQERKRQFHNLVHTTPTFASWVLYTLERQVRGLADHLLAQQPDSVPVRMILTRLHWTRHELKTAYTYTREACQHAPDDQYVLWYVSALGRFIGEATDALAASQKLVKLAPENGQFRGEHAASLLAAGRWEEAEREFVAARSQAPGEAWIAWHHAKCLVLLGRDAEEVRATCRGATLPANHVDRIGAEGWIAYAELRCRRAARKARECLHAINLESEGLREEYRCLLGLALLRQGRGKAGRGRRILEAVAKGRTGFAALAARTVTTGPIPQTGT